jgi:hypothetical protein
MEGSIESSKPRTTGIRYGIRVVLTIHKPRFKTASALIEWCRVRDREQ